MKLRAATSFWTEASTFLRVTSVLLWALGFACLGVGWQLDLQRGWSNFPFLTNMFSALTGALFGGPAAVLILQHVSNQELNRAERRAALRLTRTLWADLLPRLDRLPRDDLWRELLGREQSLRGVVDSLRAAYQYDLGMWLGREEPDECSVKSLDEFDRLFRDACRLWTGEFGSRAALRNQLLAFRTRLELVVTSVSPQLLALGVPFPDEHLLGQVYDDLDWAIELLSEKWWVEDAALITEWLEKIRTDTDGFTIRGKSPDAREFMRYAIWGMKAHLNDSIDSDSRYVDTWSPSRATTFYETLTGIRKNVSRLESVTRQLG